MAQNNAITPEIREKLESARDAYQGAFVAEVEAYAEGHVQGIFDALGIEESATAYCLGEVELE